MIRTRLSRVQPGLGPREGSVKLREHSVTVANASVHTLLSRLRTRLSRVQPGLEPREGSVYFAVLALATVGSTLTRFQPFCEKSFSWFAAGICQTRR